MHEFDVFNIDGVANEWEIFSFEYNAKFERK